MSLRHVIVEGVDGAGKSTLVDKLAASLGYPIHERASTSTGGPVPDVDEWTSRDVMSMPDQTPSVYDRHPLISEPIYAPMARGVPPFGRFTDTYWYNTHVNRASESALLVVCMPVWRVVERNANANADDQMPGVLAHLRALYRAYRYVQNMWPTPIVWWNYEQPDGGYNNLVYDIRHHLNGDYVAR